MAPVGLRAAITGRQYGLSLHDDNGDRDDAERRQQRVIGPHERPTVIAAGNRAPQTFFADIELPADDQRDRHAQQGRDPHMSYGELRDTPAGEQQVRNLDHDPGADDV